MNAPRSLAAIVRPTPTCAPSLNLPTPGGLDGTPFTPTERLGWGMLTEVLACDGPDGEEVALKVVRPGCLDPREATTRLLQEAEILGRIAHPSVVALRSVGQTQDGRAYLVMPRLYGETALERLRRKGAPQRLGRAVRTVVEVLDGLSAAHAAGVVHRDVKPSNVFHADVVDGRGRRSERAILLDFSVAYERSSARSTTSHVLGTPRYLAPEQILSGALDARTDVYGAGLLAFELLTGRGPFDATSTRALLAAHLEARPRPVSAFAEVPPELDAVIGIALEKRPDRRFPTAAAFRSALLGAAGLGTKARSFAGDAAPLLRGVA
jgi:serine/threonine protein kinase